jgi:hypothetical protein
MKTSFILCIYAAIVLFNTACATGDPASSMPATPIDNASQIAALSSAHISVSATAAPGVVVPASAHYAALSATWWQWVFSQPVASNPAFDKTGAMAANGQPVNTDVYFLAGLITQNGGLTTSVERSIQLPQGKQLFFPLLNFEADNVGASPPYSVTQLRGLAAYGVTQVTSLYVKIDGVEQRDLAVYRTISPVFAFMLPSKDNLYQFFGVDITGDVPIAVGDGFYVLLSPLPIGGHLVEFGGTSKALDSGGQPATFSLDVKYHINVLKEEG